MRTIRLFALTGALALVFSFTAINDARALWKGATGSFPDMGTACNDITMTAWGLATVDYIPWYGGVSSFAQTGWICDANPGGFARRGRTWPVCEEGETKVPEDGGGDGCIDGDAPPGKTKGECEGCRGKDGEDDSGSDGNTGSPPTLVANPVNVINGNKFQRVTDFRTPGPEPLEFTRYYNGRVFARDADNMGDRLDLRLAFGWRHSYTRRLNFFGTTVSRVYAYRPDGQEIRHKKLASGLWVPFETDMDGYIIFDGTYWVLTNENHEREFYDKVGSRFGRLTKIVRPSGYTQDLSYDTDGLLESVTDSFGRSLLFTYDSRLHMETMTDPSGRVYRFTYTPYNPDPLDFQVVQALETVAYPDATPGDDTDNPKLTYHYEDINFEYALTGITDENGDRVATWAYDTRSRATLSEHAGGADRTTLAYDDVANTATVTNALGKQTVYHNTVLVNANKITRVEELASPDSPARDITYAYDANGYLSQMVDGEGNVTDYVHNIRGQATSITGAAGTAEARTTSFAWHAEFRLPLQIARPGRTTDYTWDADGKLLTRTATDTTSHVVPYSTNGETRVWTYAYDAAGLLASVDGPRTGVSDVTTYGYDASGNLTDVTNALAQVTDITAHDPRGLPLTTVDANGVTTTLAYDDRGRLTTVTADATGTPAITTIAYDDAGQVTSVTLPGGASLSYEYDAAHRHRRRQRHDGADLRRARQRQRRDPGHRRRRLYHGVRLRPRRPAGGNDLSLGAHRDLRARRRGPGDRGGDAGNRDRPGGHGGHQHGLRALRRDQCHGLRQRARRGARLRRRRAAHRARRLARHDAGAGVRLRLRPRVQHHHHHRHHRSRAQPGLRL